MKSKNQLTHYPIALKLEGVIALVVGAGLVAQRKAVAFLEAGARVRVVSPEAQEGIKKLAQEKKLKWAKRQVRRIDIAAADIVIAATNDASVNKKVSRWAQKDKRLVNVVDNSSLSSFISPAVFRIDKGIISVYTDGKDPVLSRDLKNFLKEHWDDFLSYRDRS